MKNKLISIIVPVFNAQSCLERCIASIVDQSYQNIEIILIDDGSTDRSLNICNQYAKKDHRIKVFHKKNGGVSSARNFGLKKANGDYIAFVDADDYIDERMYELLLAGMDKSGSDIGICNVCYENMDGRLLRSYDHSDYVFERNDYPKYSYYCNYISGYVWNKIYSRDLIFLQSGESVTFDCDITIAEDSLFNYVIFDNNKRIKYSYINNRLYHYILNVDSATMKCFNEEKLSYFEAIEKEIHILRSNGIDADFLMANYIINSVKIGIIMSKMNTNNSKSYETIRELAKKYKKEINYSKLSLTLLIKLFISLKLKFIYALKIMIKNERN